MEPTEEEKATELEATQEIKEDEVRENIITEFGFDEVDDADRIDKLVQKEVEDRKKLSAAIGQKIKWRTEATKPKEEKKPAEAPPESKKESEDIGKAISQEFEKRELDSLEYSDELKEEIKRVAQVQGISVKAAVRDPYITFKIGEYEKEQQLDEASTTRTNRSGGKREYSIDNPPEVDMSTEKGREEWAEYKKAMAKQGF